MEDLIRDFVVETLESLDQLDAELLRFEREPGDPRIVAQVYRLLHTIKGTCGFLSLHRLERIAHAAEELISRFRDGGAASSQDVTLTLAAIDRIKAIIHAIAETGREPSGGDSELIGLLALASQRRPAMQAVTEIAVEAPLPDAPQAPLNEPTVVRQNVRVAVERLDHLMNMVSELVLVRNQLLDLARREDAGGFKLPLQRLSHITAELQDGVMRTRMQSIGAAWSKISRTVRDLSVELGKDIRLETLGADTEIDRQILEVIKDCIVHMIRNAADHGIEAPRERVAAGKPPQGTIRLRAGQEGSHIVMEVADDGRGLDLDRIRAKAYGQGIVDDDKLGRMGDQDIARLIFAPGFSTASQISNLSGRGVGLDAVRTSIEAVGGTVDVFSRPGQGTSIQLRMPLTLAVAGVLIVETAGQFFALPQVVISELVRPQHGGDIRLDRLGDTPVLRLRDRLVPVIDLAETLGEPAGQGGDFVIVCELGQKRFGLAVNAVHQTEDMVIKPLSARMRHIPYFSGATIRGDGSVILILEPAGFAAKVRDNLQEDAPTVATRSEDELTSLLIFRAADDRKRAVPLALVSRLEEFDAARFEQLGSQHVIQYDGALLPIVTANSAQVLLRSGVQPVLKFRHNGRRIGVAVDEIVDVIDARLSVTLSSELPGYIGSAIIGGETMPVLDVAALFGGASAVGDQDEASHRLLLVEPAAFFQALLMPLLAGAGFDVVLCRAHSDVPAMLAEARYQAIIVDLDQPQAMSMLETSTAGPERFAGAIVGVATRPTGMLRTRAHGAGFSDIVGKFDRRALLRALGVSAPDKVVAA